MQSIVEALAKLVDTITRYAEPAIRTLGKVLQFLGDHSALLIPLFGFLVTKISGFASQIPIIGGVISKLGGNFGFLFDSLKNFVSLNPGLTALIGLFGTGFVKALRNSEEFRNTFKNIGASLHTVLNNLMEAFNGIFQTVSQIVQSLAESGVIQGILQGVATALEVIAKAIASIPPEVLATLISFFVSLKLLKSNPIFLVATGIALLVGKIKELGGISKVLENLPETLGTIGHNMMTGLVKGIQEGASKVLQFVKDTAKNIVNVFKTILGIHSPSTVMYGVGENIVLGLANGIEDNSNVIQVAMNNLAKDILSLSEKVIGNKVDFGILDIAGQYKEWKKLTKMFAQGSEQYNYAVQKMEDARKQANLRILDLQNTYNDALDETIDKIANMYGLFDEVNLSNNTNANKILKNLDQQVAKMNEWAEAQEIIASSSLDAGLIEQLQEMGVSSTSELSAIANMTADELSTLNEMWLKKQKIANDTGVKQMKNLKDETLNQINGLKNGIDGATVDVEDVGGRLVSNIAEGIYGAMPTLESAFSQLGDYIAKAQKELAKSGVGTVGGGDDTDIPDAGDETEKTLKDTLEGMTQKVKDMLPNILLGIIGAWGLSKLLPKIFSMAVSKINIKGPISGALAGLFGRAASGNVKGAGKDALISILDEYIFATDEGTTKAKLLERIRAKVNGLGVPEVMEDAVKKSTKATKPAQKLAESSQAVSGSMQSTSQSFSKISGVMDSIKKGAQTVIWIAGAIAAVAGALWLTYNALKDVDFKKLTGQLAMMGLAVVEFGGLAWAADKLAGIDWKSILIVAGIAADIALVALACRGAYELMKDIPWDGFGSMLGMMASALGAFGLMNGILGIKVVALAEAFGLLVSAGIMVEIIGLSKSIREAYETMKVIPWDGFGKMLGMMAETLMIMGGLNAPLGALIVLEALGWASVSMICDELIKVAKALVVVNNSIPEDFGSLEKKLGYIKTTLEKINGLDLGTVIGMMVTSWSAGPVERIMDMYGKVAEELSKLSKLDIDEKKVNENLDQVKAAMESVKSKTGIISGWLKAWSEEANANSVESAARVVLIYGEVADTLSKLGNVEIPKNAQEGVTRITQFMEKVLETLRNNINLVNKKVKYDEIEKAVGNAQSIINKFTEIIPTVSDGLLGEDVPKINVDDAKKVIDSTGKIVTAIADFMEDPKLQQVTKIGYKEQIVEKTQSILNKFTGILPTIKQLIGDAITEEQNKTAVETISTVRNLVYELGKINEASGIENKEKIVDKTQSILNKFTGIVPTIDQLVNQNLDNNAAIKRIQTVRHLVWEVGQINQNESDSLDAKAEIVEKSKTILTKLLEFSNLMKDFESTDRSGMIQTLTDNLYQLVSNVQNTLTEQTSGFENVGSQLGQALANGIKAVDFANVGNEVQSKIWHAIDARMNDEYYQGRSMGEKFRQGLYEIDYGNAGWWAVQGFINGAWGRAGNGDGVYHTGWWIANEFLRGLKDRGEQGSPWKTTIESGNWAIQGLIEGIRQKESALVNEATALADEVVSALTMDNLTLSPELNAYGAYAPTMVTDGDYAYGGGGGVVINQNNDIYTEIDMEAINRDLAWQLSSV